MVASGENEKEGERREKESESRAREPIRDDESCHAKNKKSVKLSH